MGHPLLAGASARRVDAAMTMLKRLPVRLVVTAHDPVRQVLVQWQQGVRDGGQLSFEDFRHRVLDPRSDTGRARESRARTDLPGVPGRWSTALPAKRVHVVCGPPAGAPWPVLWQCSAAAAGWRRCTTT